ncbi:hypothetical protein [Halobacillus litoralis]|uniref:hypothetical protein n=1 Tax=Halobacillus litoralis TaxID=45668 RepID=UPI0024938A23|nr:hypothetical protein [Halobacillus litoralis]
MLEVLMIITTVALVGGYFYILMKRRKHQDNPHGWKGYVTPTIFLLAPVLALASYLFEFGGMVTWFILGFAFLSGAYFTKYLPQPEESHS